VLSIQMLWILSVFVFEISILIFFYRRALFPYSSILKHCYKTFNSGITQTFFLLSSKTLT
jgi:hypothetical protein